MVHRAVQVHWALINHKPTQLLLTKGDNNEVVDVPLYPPGRHTVTRSEVIGLVRGYVPWLGWIAIAPRDFSVHDGHNLGKHNVQTTAYNSGLLQVESEFYVSQEVVLLGLTLYLAGNAFGPLLWAPMSEAFGRKPSVLIPIFGLMAFSFASATPKDIQTLLITLFLARGAALLVWGLAVIVGPLVAPIVGEALVVNLDHTGWR
ncbi:hypothetical protein KCU62_g9667, partial [Aureobasidium sp. EXF-3399]